MRLNKTLKAAVSSVFLASALVSPQPASAQIKGGPQQPVKTWTTARICAEIDRVARLHNLPRATFTRLIWTESRFDIRALSPKGAQGIAQFMPQTARAVGLADPWDPAQALPASAALLAELRAEFGNFALAAAAYNAGPGRVKRWLAGRSRLPFETQDYVAALTGKSAEEFKSASAKIVDFSLKEGVAFKQACEALPVLKTRFRGAIAGGEPRRPWGVQVAGHFSQARALRTWARVRGRLGAAIGSAKPGLHRQRGPRGTKPRWTVRLGTDTRPQAIALCQRIRRAGGFCLVRKN